MLKLKDIRGIWHVCGRIQALDGTRVDVRKTTGLPARKNTRRLAERFILPEWKRAVEAGVAYGKTRNARASGGVTVEDAARSYCIDRGQPLSFRQREKVVALEKGLGEVQLRELTRARVEAWAVSSKRKERIEKSSSTYRERLNVLRTVLNHVRRLGWTIHPDMDRLRVPKPPKTRPRWLEPEEVDAFIECVEDYWQPLVTFLFFTGARPVEAERMRWEDVREARQRADGTWTRATATLRSSKGRGGVRERLVVLVQRVLDLLPERGEDARLVFTQPNGQPVVPRALEAVFREARARAAERHGMHMPITAYWARHTVGTLVTRNTGNINLAKEILGHASVATTEIYAHNASREIRDAMDSLDVRWKGGG